MWLQVFDKDLFWNNSANSLSKELGLKLSAGMDLANSLESLALERKKSKTALLKSAEQIKNGIKPEDALNNRKLGLSPKDRYILSLPIENERKGEMLLASAEIKKQSIEFTFAIKFFIFSVLMIFNSFAFSAFMVMPMFFELYPAKFLTESLGMKIIYFFVHRGGVNLILALVGWVCLLFLSIWLCMKISKAKKYKEEAELISMLSCSKTENQWANLELVANRLCFPKCSESFKKISDAVNSGESVENSILSSGVTPILSWLLVLSLHDNDRSFLKEGAVMLLERSIMANNCYIRTIEIILVIFESIIVYFAAYGTFGSLNSILLESMI